MKKECFVLRVKPGTEIISSSSEYVVNEVPDNALELMKKGCIWLQFSPKAKDELKKLSNNDIQHLLEIRRKQGFKTDVAMLDRALKFQKSTKASQKEK